MTLAQRVGVGGMIAAMGCLIIAELKGDRPGVVAVCGVMVLIGYLLLVWEVDDD